MKSILLRLRADYWISQTRKYCDFCKCWITDNKPSVDFHEKGRRHQQNVKRRLQTITKQSEYTQRQNEKFDATIRHMESAALAAYRKDVANNADMTSRAINKTVEDNNLVISGGELEGSKKVWKEAKNRDGKTYYFNVITNEQVTRPPKDGFLSIKDQRDLTDLETLKQIKALEKHNRKETLLKMQIEERDDNEERARLAREQLKQRRVVDETLLQSPPVYAPLLEPGKNDAYGKWQVVKDTEQVDWQLPAQEEYFEVPVEYEPEPVMKEFKEKTVESLGHASGDTSFKKRKIGFGARRNVRKRVEDD